MQIPARTVDFSVILSELIILIGTILIVSMINRRSMFFKNVSLTFLALIVIAGIGIAYMVKTGGALDAESKTYLETTIPHLFANFSSDTFLGYMAPEDKDKLDRATMDKFAVATNAKFGHYISFDNLQGASMVNVNPQGKQIFARYAADVKFQNGDADARFYLKKSGGQWYLVRVELLGK